MMLMFYLKPRIASILLVKPPQRITVAMTIMDVVVRMRRLADVDVFRMASAKAMAPLKPEKSNKCCMFRSILFRRDLDRFIRNESGYIANALAITIAI